VEVEALEVEAVDVGVAWASMRAVIRWPDQVGIGSAALRR